MNDSAVEVFLADRPSAEVVDPDLFGQFIGQWDLEVTWFENGRPVRREPGEWHFTWVLGGRAVQDIWVVPPLADQRRGAAAYEHGASLRFPDASGQFWCSTWHGPVHGVVIPFTAKRDGADIVLAGQHPDGRRLHWVFFDIKPNDFAWRNESSTDDGATWTVTQSFTAVRRR